MELTYDVVVVTGADHERGLDFGVRIFEENGFCEMRVVELLVEDNISVIVLDDQPEFFGSGVFEFHFENDVVICGTCVFNGYLFVGDRRRLLDTAAISLAGERVANEYYNGCQCYCDYFYYLATESGGPNIFFLY